MKMSYFKLQQVSMLILLGVFTVTKLEAVPIDNKLAKGKASIEYIESLIKTSKDLAPNSKLRTQLLERLKEVHLKNKALSHGLLIPKKDQASKNIKKDDFWELFQGASKFIKFVDNIDYKVERLRQKSVILKESILKAEEENEEVQTWQIQYAIYSLRIKNLNEATPILKKEVLLLKVQLNSLVKDVFYSIEGLEREFSKLKKETRLLENELLLISIEKDQVESSSLVQSEDSNRKNEVSVEFQNLHLDLVRKKVESSFAFLKNKKPEESLLSLNKARELIENIELTEKNQLVLNSQIELAHSILAKNVSSFDLLLYNTSGSALDAINKVFAFISEPIIFYDDKKITIWGTIKLLLIFIFGFFLAQLYKARVTSINHGKYNITATNKTIISNLGYYFIVLITFFAALNLLGLDLSSLTVIAGALSVGIGFGLQKIFANFMAGIIMMFEKSIKMGDYIEASSSLRGRVTEIRMRSSTITTNDNINLIIPNSTLIESNVINWTLNDTIVRLKIPFSVAYGTSDKDLEKAVFEGLESSSLEYIKHDKNRVTELRMTQMNTSGIDYCLLVWVSGISTKLAEKTKSDFLKFIYNSLSEHNIEIPFPQLDVHVKESPGPK